MIKKDVINKGVGDAGEGQPVASTHLYFLFSVFVFTHHDGVDVSFFGVLDQAATDLVKVVFYLSVSLSVQPVQLMRHVSALFSRRGLSR